MYSIRWDFHTNKILNGFSHLQQSEEFVDMTIAAGGHLVKVHQNIVALASPFIREMLKSASCQHPILYFGDINHNVLCYILEYIYTGEVNVPKNEMEAFFKAAKGLHIIGIERNDNIQAAPKTQTVNKSTITSEERPPDVATCNIESNNPGISMRIERNIQIDHGYTIKNTKLSESDNQNTFFPIIVDTGTNFQQNIDAPDYMGMNQNINDYNTISDNPQSVSDQNMCNQEISNNSNLTKTPQVLCHHPHIPVINIDSGKLEGLPNYKVDVKIDDDMSENLLVDPKFHISINPDQNLANSNLNINNSEIIVSSNSNNCNPKAQTYYTKSNRGSLQLILNRFMYYCQYQTIKSCSRKRRWRCIDYRYSQCPASVDTVGETIVCRKGNHNHSFHDSKITKKYKKSKIFTSLSEVLQDLKPTE